MENSQAENKQDIPEQDTPKEVKNENSLDGFGDIKLQVSAVLGNTTMTIEQFLKLGRGAIVELNENKNSKVKICVNGQYLAAGDITIVGDNIGVSISEFLS